MSLKLPSTPNKMPLLALSQASYSTSHQKKENNENKSLFRSARYVAKKLDEKKFIETKISNLRESQKLPDSTLDNKLRESQISGMTGLKENVSELKETPLSRSAYIPPTDREKGEGTVGEAQSRNIFFHKELMNVHFSDKDDGPRFTEDGRVLKHTILGKREWFMKYYNKATGSIKEEEEKKDSQNNIDSRRPSRPKTSNPTSFRGDVQIRSQNQRRGTHEGRPLSAVPFPINQNDSISQNFHFLNVAKEHGVRASIRKTPEKAKWDKTIDEEALRKEYQSILNRRSEAKRQDLLTISKLPHADKTFATREERIFSKYENREREFQDYCEELSNNLKRKQEDLILMKIEENRSVVEIKETLEFLKTGEEKHGKGFWIKFLRKFPEEEKVFFEKEKKTLENIPEKTSLLNRPHSAIATIRKPFIKQKVKRPKSSERVHQQYQQIFKENEEILEDVRAPLEDADELVVFGQNKLEQEYKSARSLIQRLSKDNKYKFYLRRDDPNAAKTEEEVIAKHFKLKDVTKETGGIGFPNLKLNY